jgi:hypothetical protein
MTKRKETMALKKQLIKENDWMWSLMVRIRDGFTCKMCGKKTDRAQASHIVGRSNWAVRWDINNGVTLCFYCHRYRIHGGEMTDEDRIEFHKKAIGEENYKLLLHNAKIPVKKNLAYIKTWNSKLREQFKELTGMEFEEYIKKQKSRKGSRKGT